MSTIDLDALEAVAAASGAIATAPVLDLIARVRELEEAIETARDHEWSGYGMSDTWHILTRALNDKEAEK